METQGREEGALSCSGASPTSVSLSAKFWMPPLLLRAEEEAEVGEGEGRPVAGRGQHRPLLSTARGCRAPTASFRLPWALRACVGCHWGQ